MTRHALLAVLFAALASVAQAQWQPLPGRATDIGVGPNGAAWVIGIESVDGGRPIYRWDGNDWDRVAGGAVRLDIDPQGQPWVVNSAGEILRRDRGGWTRLPGLARDIGIGANGVVWVVGVTPVTGGFSVHRWNGRDWDRVPGGALRIDVDPRGRPWVVNDRGEILRLDRESRWERLPGSGTAVTIGADGTAWLLGTDRVDGGHSIHWWTGSGWERVPGGAVALSAGQVPWLVNSSGNVFRWDGRR
jgi:hypothetical protein